MNKDVKVFVVNSAKGGVGKTRTAKEIALELLNRGHTVSVFDLDVTTPNVDKMDGIKVYSSKTKQMPTKTSIRKFIKDSFADSYSEYVIIDTPPTISEMYISISSYIRRATFLFVTTRDENAVKDTAVGMRFFAMYGINVSNIILNMADVFDGLSDREVENTLDAKIISVVNKGCDLKEVVSFIEGYCSETFILTNADGKPLLSKLSKITEEEVENDRNIPLRFYNLETWEIIRERIIEKEGVLLGWGSSYLNVSSSQIEPFLNYEEGDCVFVRVLSDVGVAEEFLPYEIVKCCITVDASVSRGLPMAVTMAGTHLWIGEISIASDDDIRETLNEGGFDTGNSIILDFFNQMYMYRVFNRSNLEKERRVIRLWEKKVGINVDNKDKMFTLALLENDVKRDDFDNFKYLDYIAEKEGEYKKHLEEIVND